jgi:hypothetical protein
MWKRFLLLGSAVVCAPAARGAVDDLETVGPDGTAVTSRLVEGVIVTIATASGADMTARTYHQPPRAFGGIGNVTNVPLAASRLSGNRFLSSAGAGSGGAFQEAQPIRFDFSEPVRVFGLTTVDLLEDISPPTDHLTLRAYDASGTVVDEMTLTGPQGDSGLDLDLGLQERGSRSRRSRRRRRPGRVRRERQRGDPEPRLAQRRRCELHRLGPESRRSRQPQRGARRRRRRR